MIVLHRIRLLGQRTWHKSLTQKRPLVLLLMSEVIQTGALTNLLDRKGIISRQELLWDDFCALKQFSETH